MHIKVLDFKVEKPRRWTEGAIECYQRGCRCGRDCDNYHMCRDFLIRKTLPRMKANVIASVRVLGKPQVEQHLRKY